MGAFLRERVLPKLHTALYRQRGLGLRPHPQCPTVDVDRCPFSARLCEVGGDLSVISVGLLWELLGPDLWRVFWGRERALKGSLGHWGVSLPSDALKQLTLFRGPAKHQRHVLD
jgi:hypothetical protein